MYPGRGNYTYNNGQSANEPNNGGFSRPQGQPPSGNGYQRPNAPPPGGNYYQRPSAPPPGGEHYQRPSAPPPSGDHYQRPNAPPSQSGSNHYERPSAPPPGNNHFERPSAPLTGGNQYQRPNAPPQSSGNTRDSNTVNGPQNYNQPSSNMSRPPQQMQNIQGAPVSYQYSQCNGNRKALLVGINYFNTQNQLRGCINDAHNMFNFLTTKHGFRQDDIVMLTDDQQDPIKIPTRANIIRAMQWLVKNAQPNDSLFFHYSGHGGQTKDLDGDEEDGMDDVIYPVDFQTAGDLVDDIMHDIMVKPLQAGVRLTALFDSCHSGTVLDLPYTYSTKGIIKEPNVWKDLGSGGLQAAMAYASGNTSALLSSLGSLATSVKNKVGTNVDRENVIKAKFSQADCIMFSGSKDNQTSADAVENGQATGAMSYAFVKVLTLQSEQSYLSLLQNMRQEMASKYSQKPQLSSSHPIDVNLKFIL